MTGLALLGFWVQRVDPVMFAKRLEGAPQQERLEVRLRQLETRNADLERQLGL